MKLVQTVLSSLPIVLLLVLFGLAPDANALDLAGPDLLSSASPAKTCADLGDNTKSCGTAQRPCQLAKGHCCKGSRAAVDDASTARRTSPACAQDCSCADRTDCATSDRHAEQAADTAATLSH